MAHPPSMISYFILTDWASEWLLSGGIGIHVPLDSSSMSTVIPKPDRSFSIWAVMLADDTINVLIISTTNINMTYCPPWNQRVQTRPSQDAGSPIPGLLSNSVTTISDSPSPSWPLSSIIRRKWNKPHVKQLCEVSGPLTVFGGEGTRNCLMPKNHC